MIRGTWPPRPTPASTAAAAAMTLHAALAYAGQVVTFVTAVAALVHTLTHHHRGGPR